MSDRSHQTDAARPREPGPLLAKASVWVALRHRLFLALSIASLVSNVGTWMQNIGAAWLMTSLAPSPLMVALIQTASNLPILLLALPAGAYADILNRRRLLIVCQTWMALAAGVLGWLTITGHMTPWLLLFFSLLMGVGVAMNLPVWQAIVPELVPREDLPPAITLNSMNFNAARAIGPALGGLVVAWAGAGLTFIVNALSFLAVIGVVYGWRRPNLPTRLPSERVMGAIRAGVRYTRFSFPLRAVMWRTAGFVIGGSAIWAVIPLVARFRLGMGAAGFGILVGCFGSGAIVSGMFLPRLNQIFSRNAIAMGTVAGMGVLMALLAGVRNVPLACVLMAMIGGTWTVSFSVLNVCAQLAVPNWVMGRALSIYQLVVQGGLAAGSLIWGGLAERTGVPMAMVLAGASMVASLLLALRYRLPPDVDPTMEPAPHRAMPQTALEIDPDSGPVLVTVEYRIEPHRAAEFERAMDAMRVVRSRDGATAWGLFFDTADPARFIEHFLVDSWVEHVRQHERGMAGDLAIERQVRAFHLGPNPPAISHLLAASAMHEALKSAALNEVPAGDRESAQERMPSGLNSKAGG